MNDNLLTAKRFADLAKQADRKGIVCFSDFLTLNELNILHDSGQQLVSSYETSGGYEDAERQIAAFIPDALYYMWKYPIDCIRIVPSYPKYAQKLSHRDILGTLMSLGVERAKFGDILVKESEYYLFVKQEMTSYIMENLTQIRHTLVRCEVIEETDLQIAAEFEEFEKIIASNRLDAIIAALSGKSRNQSVLWIQNGKIFINGAECLHNTYICKPSDVISIRGVGKFVFEGICGETRKNKIKIKYKQYK